MAGLAPAVPGTGTLPRMTSAAVVVPVKAFRAAKVRLAPALAPAARAALARELADVVVGAASPLPVVVVCDDDEVRDWAVAASAEVVWCPGRGLNGAVADGVASLADRGIERAVVAHSDLPLASSLAWVADFDGVTLVPDRRLDGTNVVAVPTGAGFEFAYGKGSFARHRAEAARCGLDVRVVEDAALGWDVDLPDDLAWPRTGLSTTAVSTVLSTSAALPGPAATTVPPGSTVRPGSSAPPSTPITAGSGAGSAVPGLAHGTPVAEAPPVDPGDPGDPVVGKVRVAPPGCR